MTSARTDSTRRYLDEQGRYVEGEGRPEPSPDHDTATMLLQYLERQRATFAWKVGGLDAGQLRTTHLPSVLTLGGMLKHLARFEDDMSHEWLAGKGQIAPWNAIDWDTDHDWDWRSAAGDSAESLRAMWSDAVDRSRAMFNTAIERVGVTDGILYILLNLIEEYARHNGNADLIRESIDGLVGHEPPES
jgi:hypothetical protein